MHFITVMLIGFIAIEGLLLAFKPQLLKEIMAQTPNEILRLAGIIEILIAAICAVLLPVA